MKRILFCLLFYISLTSIYAQKSPKVFRFLDLDKPIKHSKIVVSVEDQRYDTSSIGMILSGMSQRSLREAKMEGGLENAFRHFIDNNVQTFAGDTVSILINKFHVHEEANGFSESFLITYQLDIISVDNKFFGRIEGEYSKKAMDATAAGNKIIHEWSLMFLNELQMLMNTDQDYYDFLSNQSMPYYSEIDLSQLAIGVYKDLESVNRNQPDLKQFELRGKNPNSIQLILGKKFRMELKARKEKFQPLLVFDGESIYLNKRKMGSYFSNDFFKVEVIGRFLCGHGIETPPSSYTNTGILEQ